MKTVQGWISIDTSYPKPRNDEFYGHRYSEPVICMIDGKRFDRLLAYDFDLNGWVYADLHDGPSPHDYEIGAVTHYQYMPAPLDPTGAFSELDRLNDLTERQETYIADLEVLATNLGEHIVVAPLDYDGQPGLFPDPAEIGGKGVHNWVRRAMDLHAQAINLVNKPSDPGAQASQ